MNQNLETYHPITGFDLIAAQYGGSGVGNFGRVTAHQTACHGRPYSLNLHLPPLGANIFYGKKDK
jgi:1,4-alpha-glucan branching enzyme